MTIRELYDVVGGDFEDLMKRIPKESLVEKFVRKYVESGEFEKMKAAYEAEDYRSVFEISHNLKGMSANLSLASINATMSAICEAVRNGAPAEDISGMIETAQSQHELLVNTLAQLQA